MKGLVLLLLTISTLAILCAGLKSSPTLLSKLQHPTFKSHMNQLQAFISRFNKVRQQLDVGKLTVECALCGIAVNEIKGFMIENITQQEIEKYLQNDVCSLFSGDMLIACNSMVAQIPTIINMIENKQSVGVVCVELEWCEKPFDKHADPVNVPTFIINLDLPPQQRWKQVCSVPDYQQMTQFLYNTVASILPDGGEYLNDVGALLNNYYLPAEYAQEIQGCATALSIPYGWATLFNLGYEVSDACTSIVAQTQSGIIYHARNMDFWAGMGFTDTLRNITFIAQYQRAGKTLFQATTFAGYVGVLSGMKPNAFSITIDTRFYPQGLADMFYEVIAAIIEKNASLVSLLSRDVLTRENSWKSALDNLSNGELIADVYYILAGVSAGQGAVISRNRHNATNVWLLDSPSRWFLVETNYDHWEQPPWFDDRVTPANNAMNAIGQKGLTLGGMFNVLSTKPVFNLQTTYSILACPALGTYASWARWCNYPCVE